MDEDNIIHYEGEIFKPIGRLHFLIQSRSEPDTVYAVDLEKIDPSLPNGGCSCAGFSARKNCRHIDIIKKYVGENKQ